MKRLKIGNGYYRSGYGRNSIKKVNVYYIDGFAYAKDGVGSKSLMAENEITKLGYVPVNVLIVGNTSTFAQASIYCDEHKPYIIKEVDN